MKKCFAAWMWTLGVVARSYRMVVVLAALVALWVYAGYQWLGLPESSPLMLALALIWAAAQLLIAAAIVAGTAAGAASAAASENGILPLKSIWTAGVKNFLRTLFFAPLALALAWVCAAAFGWINGHAVEVASYLTFHWQKPVSYVLIGEIYDVIELLVWAVLSGFLLSFFLVLMHAGWRSAIKQAGELLTASVVRSPFFTSLLSLVVFGGLAYELATWRPLVTPGFWDYVQLIARFSLVALLISASLLFWLLSLARLWVSDMPSDR